MLVFNVTNSSWKDDESFNWTLDSSDGGELYNLHQN